MLSPIAYAQDAAGAVAEQPSIFDSLIMFLPIILIFWFLILRPQNKRMKEHRAMVAGVAKGDKVVTAGGIIGTVTKVGEDDATVEIGEGVKVKIVKSTLSSVTPKNAPVTPAPKKEK